ncbi:acyl dehydratase [Williamsia limnetica]|uniref:Acyl dehydratase n=1 Tax=Williamsia limnetica TaxID=882452 RepID=A0A318RCM1_WILLI|nr:MaoC family dehydratase [Williamsia limnetica]PYE12446.1 acyl dehydratase [Williamsia limnetica]
MTIGTTIAIGTEIPRFQVKAVSGEHIRQMALILRDPNPIHFDLDAVAAAGLGDREINQGGVTMAYIVDMLTAWVGSGAALSGIKCRFRGNVRAGDEVIAGGVVTDISGGAAVCDVWADLADGTRVLDGAATVALP